MKIDYISDIHLDFRWLGKHFLQEFVEDLLPPKLGDVLIIAGDIGHDFEQNTQMLSMFKDYYRDIIIVHGNHDLYLVSEIRYKYNWDSFARLRELQDFCESNEQLHFLNGNTVEIGGLTVGGTGMSWDDTYYRTHYGEINEDELLYMFNTCMNDSRMITNGYNTPFDPMEYFQNELAKLNSISSADVIVTHYLPVEPPDLPERFRTQSSTFYMFDGGAVINRLNPKLWIFGHTHEPYDFVKGDTRFLCNPLGYPREFGDRNTGIVSVDIDR